MAGRRDRRSEQPSPPRPSFTSQLSSSVPSTPQQHARDAPFRARTPSPSGDLGSHSPRSVSSEANGALPTLRKPRAGCKYESNAAFGRRRIPYNIGADLLEKAKQTPKASLTDREDAKLSGDMRELYDRLLPSAESEARRSNLVKKLESILHREWSGSEFKVHVFGSSGNLLCTSESDVDICIQTSMKKLETMHILAEALAKHGMERVICVAYAKVPIVKIWDPEFKLACDINVNNTLALENTRMIKTYVQIDERVRPLAMIIKHWTKQRILNDAAIGGTLSSYTWICMIINFLQTRTPPVLPALHQMHGVKSGASDFADDLDSLRGFGRDNKETLAQLLFSFFRYYGHEIDYETAVISVRHGKVLSRKEKGWDIESLTKEGRDRLCVEEPFNTSRNLGNSADPTAFRGIHLELRRAFDLLAEDGQLGKCCEQYEFPTEEKPVWRKPPPAPKPVLTRSNSHSGRGGRGSGNSRGGRNGIAARHNQSARRASSGAAFAQVRYPLAQGLSLGPSAIEILGRSSLHDQLSQQYQLLQFQQDSLKAQLLAQAQFQAQAQAQAQVQAQAHSHSRLQASQASASASPLQDQLANGYASPHLVPAEPLPPAPALYPGYYYHYPPFYDHSQSMSRASSRDGSRTNPSSPAFAPSMPALRRGLHRPSVTDASPSGSVRSQSQPARPIANSIGLHGVIGHSQDLSTAVRNPLQPLAPAEHGARQANTELFFSQNNVHTSTVQGSDLSTPKEYVGYCVDESLRAQPNAQTYPIHQLPFYRDALTRNYINTGHTQHLSTPLRRLSRSPSPLAHHRSYSTGNHSATLPEVPLKAHRSHNGEIQSEQNGLLIVNGSVQTVAAKVHEQQNETTESNSVCDSDDQDLATPPTSSITSPEEQAPLDLHEAWRQQQIAHEVAYNASLPTELPLGALNGAVNGMGTSEDGRPSVAQSAALQSSPVSLGSCFPIPIQSAEMVPSPLGYSADVRLSNGVIEVDPVRSALSNLDITQSFQAVAQHSGSNDMSLVSPTHDPGTAWHGPMQEGESRKDSLAAHQVMPSKKSHYDGYGGTRHAFIGNENNGPILPGLQPTIPFTQHINGVVLGNSQPNIWQKQGRKGGRKRNKSTPIQKSSPDLTIGPEPLPMNEADRKGG